MSAQTVTLAPTIGPAENAPETTVLSVPVVAFPQSYDYTTQWSVGLIVAGMMKGAKWRRYGEAYATTFALLKEPYRQYKHKNNLSGSQAWLAWYTKFAKPALDRLGRRVRV